MTTKASKPVTLKDLSTNLEYYGCTFLGKGNFHKTYKLKHKIPYEGKLVSFVLKTPLAAGDFSDNANSPERTVRKLRMIHSDTNYPFIFLSAYRFIFLKQQNPVFSTDEQGSSKAQNKSLPRIEARPHFIYVYISNDRLFASFMNDSEQLETHPLEDLETAQALKHKIIYHNDDRMIDQDTTLAEENSILARIGCARSIILMPFFSETINPLQEKMNLLTYLIDLYRQKRIIILDTFGNNFAKDSQGCIVCIDTDYAVHRNSPVSRTIFYDAPGVQQQFFSTWQKYEETMGQTLNAISLPKVLFYMEHCLKENEILDEHINVTVLSGVQIFCANQEHLLAADMDALVCLSDKLHEATGLTDLTLDPSVYTPLLIRRFHAASMTEKAALVEETIDLAGCNALQMLRVQESQQFTDSSNTYAQKHFTSKGRDMSPLTLPPPVENSTFFKPIALASSRKPFLSAQKLRLSIFDGAFFNESSQRGSKKLRPDSAPPTFSVSARQHQQQQKKQQARQPAADKKRMTTRGRTMSYA